MPYIQNADLPKGVKNNLPPHAQDIYIEAFNHAWEQYRSPDKRRDPHESQETVAHKVAWSAVEKKYKKNVDGHWVAIGVTS
jgi:cation transport regulator